MNRNPTPRNKVSEYPAERPRTSESAITGFSTLLVRGVERLADLQKQTLEVLNRQNKDINSTLGEALRATPAMPGKTVLELTEEAVEDWTSALNKVLDLTVQQSAQALECVKEGSGKSAALLTDLVRQSAGRAIAAQQITLEFAALQTKAVSEAVKCLAGIEEPIFEAVTYSMQRGLDALIRKEKEFLAAAEPLENKTNSGAVHSGNTKGLQLVRPAPRHEHES
jgi:hypothetical protein